MCPIRLGGTPVLLMKFSTKVEAWCGLLAFAGRKLKMENWSRADHEVHINTISKENTTGLPRNGYKLAIKLFICSSKRENISTQTHRLRIQQPTFNFKFHLAGKSKIHFENEVVRAKDTSRQPSLLFHPTVGYINVDRVVTIVRRKANCKEIFAMTASTEWEAASQKSLSNEESYKKNGWGSSQSKGLLHNEIFWRRYQKTYTDDNFKYTIIGEKNICL